MKSLVLSIVLTISISQVFCFLYDSNDLVFALRELGESNWRIPIFVCRAMESYMNSSSIQPIDDSDLKLYGIFRFPKVDLTACKMTIAEAIDDDITDDVRCLSQILDDRSEKFVTLDGFSLAYCLDQWRDLPPFFSPQQNDSSCHQSKSDVETKISGFLVDNLSVFLLVAILSVVVLILVLNFYTAWSSRNQNSQRSVSQNNLNNVESKQHQQEAKGSDDNL